MTERIVRYVEGGVISGDTGDPAYDLAGEPDYRAAYAELSEAHAQLEAEYRRTLEEVERLRHRKGQAFCSWGDAITTANGGTCGNCLAGIDHGRMAEENERLRVGIKQARSVAYGVFGWLNLGDRLCVCHELPDGPVYDGPETYTPPAEHDVSCDKYAELMALLRILDRGADAPVAAGKGAPSDERASDVVGSGSNAPAGNAAHSCIVCPVEIRNLTACAFNVLASDPRSGGEWERFWRKLSRLKDAVVQLQPTLDAHFVRAVPEKADEAEGSPVPVLSAWGGFWCCRICHATLTTAEEHRGFCEGCEGREVPG